MFRKLQDRMVAAASNALGIANTTNSENERSAVSPTTTTTVQSLQALGDYTVTEIESALHTAGGNIDRAAEILLTQPQQLQQQPQRSMLTNTANTTDRMDEDMELQRALQQSLDMQEQQQQQQSSRSEIMNQAAEAAFRRADMANNSKKTKTKPLNASTATTTQKRDTPKPTIVPARPIRTKSELLRQHHPDVKLIPKLQDKSTEEQILRTVDRMKHHPAAVDTLYRALSMIYNTTHPENMKYRRIDTSTPGYQRSVAPAPGTTDFLRAMKFHNEHYHQNSPILVLSDPMYDPALIYLGLSALEQIKLTSEYILAKKQMVFLKDVNTLLLETTTSTATNNRKPTTSPEDVQQQTYYLSLCPKEPSEGRGALLQIHITDTYTIRRRFDSDDTMSDVLHWIAGTVGTTIYQRIIQNHYCLMDVNHTHRIPIDVNGAARHYTLQYIGCWPSGRLQLQPVVTNETDMDCTNYNTDGNAKVTTGTGIPSQYIQNGGKSRGLASGTSSSDDE